MTPAARIQSAIEILDGLAQSRLPADRFIREYFRARRFAGSKDRAAVSARVFDVFRHRASFAWRMKNETPRALVMASLLSEGVLASDLETIFDGGRYAPAALSASEKSAIREASGDDAPLHVRAEFPLFLHGELERAFDGRIAEEMTAMVARAPIDLRVNTLRASREDVLAALRSEGYDAEPAPHAPFGIRIPASATGLEKTPLFLSGAYEFQDEAAQVACLLSGAKPGMRVLDLASGAGGKALALAALMENSGEIVAHDIAENRLAQIAPRAARAGAGIIRTASHAPAGEFDVVFLDAPCSGSGTWRRQPENKWRLTPERLGQLNALQDKLLDEGAARVKRRGALVYATCSILPRENEDRVEAFLARHPNFAMRPARDAWRKASGAPWKATGEYFRATPLSTGTDGFFAAVFERKS